MPESNMTDFERDVLNDIHSLAAQVGSLNRSRDSDLQRLSAVEDSFAAVLCMSEIDSNEEIIIRLVERMTLMETKHNSLEHRHVNQVRAAEDYAHRVEQLTKRHDNIVYQLSEVNTDLTNKLASLTSRHDNLVEHVSERTGDLNRLTNGHNDLVAVVREDGESIDQLLGMTQNTGGQLESMIKYMDNQVDTDVVFEEIKSVKNRLKIVERKNGLNNEGRVMTGHLDLSNQSPIVREDRLQTIERDLAEVRDNFFQVRDQSSSNNMTLNNLSRELSNLGLDVNGIRDILTAHTKRIDEVKDSVTNMNEMVGDRINQMGDDLEGFRNYLADTPVYNEALVLHLLKEQKDTLGHKIERLEQAVYTQSAEPKTSTIVDARPFKDRFASSLIEGFNGNYDVRDDIVDVLIGIPEDNLRVLMGYIKAYVDNNRSSDGIITK